MAILKRLIVWAQCVSAEERGANIVEYALLLVFIVLVAIAGITLVGQETSSNIAPVIDGF